MYDSRRYGAEAVFASASAMAMVAAQVASKATRDALYLSNFPATTLPRVMIVAGALSLLSALLVARGLTRFGPARLIPVVFGASAALFVVEWGLLGLSPEVASVGIYLHIAALGAVLISGFWSVVNERFDPHTAKATVARVGVFATLGGVVGGLAAERISALAGVPAILLMLAALHLACAFGVRGIGTSSSSLEPHTPDEAGTLAGLGVLRRSPFLLQMAGLVALCAIVDTLLDYALKSGAASQFRTGESLIQFFAIFYTGAGVLAFLLQASLGRRVLAAIGLGGTMALLPGVVVLTGVFATVVTRLWSVALVRAAEFAVSNSLFRAGFELLYTPLDPGTKRPSKVYIDVGSQRVGDMAGSGFLLALLFLLPAVSTSVIIGLAVVVAGGALFLIVRVHQGYVQQLATSLRSGAISLAETEAMDATTARTLSESQVAIDREELLSRIRELQRKSAAGTPPQPGEGAPEPAGEPSARPAVGGSLQRILDLESGDPKRLRNALEASKDDPGAVGHVIPLLDRFDVLDDVMAFLRRFGTRCIGQLTDALLDPHQPLLVRRRIPRILETLIERRAIEGLCLGLRDPDFDVRFQCARAAVRIIKEDAALRSPAADVYLMVRRELRVDDQEWEHQGRRREEAPEESVLLDPPDYARVNRSMEHVFTILSVSLDPELMRSALRGLFSPDLNLRGTALEYLETTLPDDVREALAPHLQGVVPSRRSPRTTADIERELLRKP